jgi:hypothetical protein
MERSPRSFAKRKEGKRQRSQMQNAKIQFCLKITYSENEDMLTKERQFWKHIYQKNY